MNVLKELLGIEFLAFSELIMSKGEGSQLLLSEVQHLENGEPAYRYLDRYNYLTGTKPQWVKENGEIVLSRTISGMLITELELILPK